MASAATLNVTPAAYAEGFVTAIDTNARTITMGQVTYTVRSPAELIDLHAGIEVDIAYVMEGGKRVILAVTQLEDAEGGLVD